MLSAIISVRFSKHKVCSLVSSRLQFGCLNGPELECPCVLLFHIVFPQSCFGSVLAATRPFSAFPFSQTTVCSFLWLKRFSHSQTQRRCLELTDRISYFCGLQFPKCMSPNAQVAGQTGNGTLRNSVFCLRCKLNLSHKGLSTVNSSRCFTMRAEAMQVTR